MDDVSEQASFDQKKEMVTGVQVITNSPEAIKRILRALNLRELLKCKRVCKNWKFYAEKVLNERQGVRTLLAKKREKSNWLAMADVAEVEVFFKDLDISSTFVLLFGKLPLSRPCIGGNDLFSVKELLPTNSTIIGSLSSAGVIGTNSETGKCDAYQNPPLECVSCMVFPKMDGLTIRYFNLSLERYERESFSPETTDLEAMFGIQASDRVKCLILICPSYLPFDVAREVYAAFWLRERGNVAFCGGIVEDVIELDPGAREIRELGLTGIAICGDDRVTAGSIVIPPQAKTKSKVQSHLRQFPPLVPSNGRKVNRFGVAFTCAGRGKHIFKTANVEVELIQAQFPGTPIVGIFSMGECGLTHWPPPAAKQAAGSTTDEVPLLLRLLPNVIHSYSTVVAFVAVEQN